MECRVDRKLIPVLWLCLSQYRIIPIFVVMRETFSQVEKLKSRKQIGLLFEQGDSVKEYPIRLKYLKLSETSSPVKVAFSVPKRNFKLAVDRIRVKRLLRESYRKNKSILLDNLKGEYIVMFMYSDKTAWKQLHLDQKMVLVMNKLTQKLNDNE